MKESANCRGRFDTSDSERVYQLANDEEASPLSLNVKHALELIELAIARFGIDGLSISFNGGKDSTVLIHLFAAALLHNSSSKTQSTDSSLKISGLYIRCRSPFPQVDEFVKCCQETYVIDLMTVEDSLKNGLSAFIAERPSTKAILIGTRVTDPNGGTVTDFDPTDPDWPSIMRVHPILNWGYSHVWQFLKELDVGWCELYNEGYTSLGSSFDTFKNPFLKTDEGFKAAWELCNESDERAGRVPGSVHLAA